MLANSDEQSGFDLPLISFLLWKEKSYNSSKKIQLDIKRFPVVRVNDKINPVVLGFMFISLNYVNKEIEHLIPEQWYQIWQPNWVRLAPNGTNLGLFKTCFSTFWLAIWDKSDLFWTPNLPSFFQSISSSGRCNTTLVCGVSFLVLWSKSDHLLLC